MTAKEAITLLQSKVDLIKREYPDIVNFWDEGKALEMAIEALNHFADDSKKVSFSRGQENDLISREAAIDAIVNTPTDVYSHDRIVSVLDGAAFRQNEIIDIINALPSAQPDPDKLHLQREQAYVQGWEDARLIDRQAAIDTAKRVLGDHEITRTLQTALHILPSAQPTDAEIQKMQDLEQAEIQKAYELGKLDAMEEMPHWIPCSERLPKDEIAYYLVTLVNHGLITYGDIDIARWDYDRRKGKESWHWCKEREVIAWMPLPEPYQEERREK